MDGNFFFKIFQTSSKISLKSHKIVVWAWFWVPWEGLETSWRVLAFGLSILGRLGGLLGRLGPKKVANMAPTWLPKRVQHRPKIEAKSDQIFDASWSRIFKGFCSIWEAKWSQVGTKIASKIDANFERRFFEKTLFFCRKNNDFEGSGGRSWEYKSIKNRSTNEVSIGRHLGIDLSWMLVDFGSQVGAKLASKIENKSI